MLEVRCGAPTPDPRQNELPEKLNIRGFSSVLLSNSGPGFDEPDGGPTVMPLPGSSSVSESLCETFRRLRDFIGGGASGGSSGLPSDSL